MKRDSDASNVRNFFNHRTKRVPVHDLRYFGHIPDLNDLHDLYHICLESVLQESFSRT